MFFQYNNCLAVVYERNRSLSNKKEYLSDSNLRQKKFSFSNADLNVFTNKKANHFNIVINKNILDEEDDMETHEENKPKSYRLEKFNVDRKIGYVSPSNSLINSTKNVHNLNKHFSFDQTEIPLLNNNNNNIENKSETNNEYSNQQGNYIIITLKTFNLPILIY